MGPGSRRAFLCTVAAPVVLVALRSPLAAHAQGLGQFSVATPGCKDDEKATPAAPQGPDFRPGSPERSSLREAGVVGTPLVLSGAVIGLTCGRVKGAVVDFWQADAKGAYDMAGFRLRGRQRTDANGGYRLETVMPGAAPGHARCIHVTVQPPGKPAFTTQLFFPDDPQNARDAAFKPELLATLNTGRDGQTASFNIILNI